MRVSPNFEHTSFSNPPTLDEKIDVFDDRVRGWQLEIADAVINGASAAGGGAAIKKIEHSGYAALSIVLSYYEMMAKTKDGYTGTGKAGEYFRKGFKWIHPAVGSAASATAADILDSFYKKTRCGLYHVGMTKKGVFLSGDPKDALTFDPSAKTLTINPHRLVPHLIDHFKSYVTDLRKVTATTLRTNFEKCFDAI